MPLRLVAFTLPECLLTSMVIRPCSLVKFWRWCANQELTVTYLNSGGKVGDTLKAIVTCDKCESYLHWQGGSPMALILKCSWKNIGIYLRPIHKRQRRSRSAWQPHKVSLGPNSAPRSAAKLALQLVDASVGQSKLTRTRYVALAWKDPRNIVEQLSPKP